MTVLKERFPLLAERVQQPGLLEQVGCAQSQDGLPAYLFHQNGQAHPLTNPVNPKEQIEQELGRWADKTSDFSRPILMLGLHPGAEVLHLFNEREQATGKECEQPLWICIDSILNLCGFLQAYDARSLITSKRVELFWHEDVPEKVEWLRSHPEFPYIFSMISFSPPETQLKVFKPFLEVAKERDEEMARFQEENDAYYDAVTDEQLAEVLSGKAGRKPRLLVPSCPWSTVIQYSIRDACRAFEQAGWETMVLNSPAVIPSHYVMQSINQFKPDLFIYVSHLRTEAPGVLSDNLMVVSWVQDPMPAINSNESACRWNDHAKKHKRDLLTGYIDQLKPFGYMEDRLVPLSMIVDRELFQPRKLTAEQQEKYTCDVCFASNAGLPTDRVVRERLVPLLKSYNCTESLLMQIHDRLWEEYRNGRSITTKDQLKAYLINIHEFKPLFEALEPSRKDALIERLFWGLNDPVYRQMVLEWLDGYAQSHPDFKLSMYGNDWDQHPRFKKYAQGPLEHGEELSIAYQAARFCLHLNAAEGPHQRLDEILASGGTPILRAGDKQSLVSVELALVMHKLFTHENPNTFEALSKQEQGLWYTYLFTLLGRELFKDLTLSPDELCARIQNEIHLWLSTSHDWILPDWGSLTFNDDAGLSTVLSGSREPTKRETGSYSGMAQSSHVVRLCSEMLSLLSVDVQMVDEELPSLSKIARIVVALNRNELGQEDLEWVDQFCLKNPNIRSITAWQSFVVTDLAYDKALPWMTRDWELGVMEGEWLLHYAQALTACGKNADAVIEYAYNADSTLSNGYARCAWVQYFTMEFNPQKALEGFKRDQQAGRLTGQCQLNFAMLMAGCGQLSEAEGMVGEIYRTDSDSKNGYAQMAWQSGILSNQPSDEALKYFERDERLNRSTSIKYVIEAGVLTRLGRQAEALACVQKAYQNMPDCKGGYTTIAAIQYLKDENLSDVLDILKRDVDEERLFPYHLVVYGAFLWRSGDLQQAQQFCRMALERSQLSWTIAASWLMRCGYDTSMINELMTPELKDGWS